MCRRFCFYQFITTDKAMSKETSERLKRDTQYVSLRAERGGKSRRYGAKSGVGRRERIKRGRGTQGPIADAFAIMFTVQ
jgi:hypothetical protein